MPGRYPPVTSATSASYGCIRVQPHNPKQSLLVLRITPGPHTTHHSPHSTTLHSSPPHPSAHSTPTCIPSHTTICVRPRWSAEARKRGAAALLGGLSSLFGDVRISVLHALSMAMQRDILFRADVAQVRAVVGCDRVRAFFAPCTSL